MDEAQAAVNVRGMTDQSLAARMKSGRERAIKDKERKETH